MSLPFSHICSFCLFRSTEVPSNPRQVISFASIILLFTHNMLSWMLHHYGFFLFVILNHDILPFSHHLLTIFFEYFFVSCIDAKNLLTDA
jgi:hypothetical protein